jgi:hypothetical protein
MADAAIAGKSYGDISRDLVERGVPTQNGKSWVPEMVRFVLLSEHTVDLLDEDKSAELRVEVNSRRKGTGQWTSGRHMLLRVLYCINCKARMYGKIRHDGRKPRYECCKCRWTISKDNIEPEVEKELRARWGSRPHMIHKVTVGDDHSREVRRLERQLDMAREFELVDTSALEARIKELKAAPHDPPKVDFVPSGMTIAEFWDSLASPDERGKFLREHGVKVYAGRGGLFLMEPTWLAAVSGWE